MRYLVLSTIWLWLILLARSRAAGIGEAWRISPYEESDESSDHPTWPRSENSAFEVRSVSGVGRFAPLDTARANVRSARSEISVDKPERPPTSEDFQQDEPKLYSLPNPKKQQVGDDLPAVETIHDIDHNDQMESTEKPVTTTLKVRISRPLPEHVPVDQDLDELLRQKKALSRVRRQIEVVTDMDSGRKMEKIGSSKSVREARLQDDAPEGWSKQPISVEIRQRQTLDQIVQQDRDDMVLPPASFRSYEAPRADFVTGHYGRFFTSNRESRDMPATRPYDDYDMPWYRNAIRERDYDYHYRPPVTYNYRYPDRYRTGRDYYVRPHDPFYYDRYREDDLTTYDRNRPAAPKPKRIIYYATLPEVVRKPVDLRNYPRPYDGLMRAQIGNDGLYKRIPGNVDPNKYRYRYPYDVYDFYSKRTGFLDRPYTNYQDDESRRKGPTKEGEGYDSNQDGRKISNQISGRDEGKVPWPVQIGTEVTVKNDDRIPGRKIFGENGYERVHSAQLQNAPDAESTSTTDIENDN
ncbi:uncharacterized protein [Prorops nasuta]|uniref:uncharacterized protein n=1 Tax=Prorops nasuta TaxID=863751 RepID=UPI0034CF0F51